MVTEKPLVSVIMPVYNTGKYLKESAMSVINQSYDNLEIILVDDGSPDEAPEICDELSKRYTNVMSFHKNNGGLSDARNFGINKASGKYVFFLDSDDTIDSGAIYEMVDIAESEKSDVVFPDRYYKCLEGESPKLCHLFEGSYPTEPLSFATDIIIEKGCAWRSTAILYSAQVIKSNNCRFPIGYTSEDVMFNLQFLSYAKKCSYIRKPTLNYLKRKGSITTSFNKDFFKTILYIDAQIEAFFKRNNLDTAENFAKRNSLLSRNYIVWLFSVFSKNSGLNKREIKTIENTVFENERVKESLKTKMMIPFFDRKPLGKIIVIIHTFLRLKFKMLAILIVKLIGHMR